MAKRRHAVLWAIGVIGLAAAYLVTRLASRATEEDDDIIDENTSPTFTFTMDERAYPPFKDDELEGVQIESSDSASDNQMVIIGIEKREFEANSSQEHTYMAVARCDIHRLWRPGVSKDAILPLLPMGNTEYYMAALPILPGVMHIAFGFMTKEQFSPCRSTRIVAITTREGILYDYPNVPTISLT